MDGQCSNDDCERSVNLELTGDIENKNDVNEHKKVVRFKNVKVYLFERRQGFDVVPATGGFALGMDSKHFEVFDIPLCNSNNNFDPRKQALKLPDSRKRSFRAEFDENFIAEKKSCITVEDKKKMDMQFEPPITVTENHEEIIIDDELLEDLQLSENEEMKEHNISLTKKYFLPLDRKVRLLKLRNAGLKNFEKNEKVVCKNIRRSRKRCGCSCKSPCLPETCECALNGIECLVDRPAFPCRCGASECNNPFGRREYDETRIRAHFRSTLMRLKAAQCQKLGDLCSPVHLRFSDL